jgi:maltose/moltooligosaccharide transporter
MKAESAGLSNGLREIMSGVVSMPRAMRPLAVVQFFTWFALFCMWLYFVPAVASGVFHGRPLGVSDPDISRQLQTEAGKPFVAQAAAIARAYEARKREIQSDLSRTGSPRQWHDAILQMLGLKLPPPDAGERIDEAALRELLAQHLGERHEVTKEEKESSLVQTLAAALLKFKVTKADAFQLAAAAAEIHTRLTDARTYQRGTAWGGVCFSAYNGTAFLFAFLLLALVKRLAARTIHRACLLCGGIGLILAVGLQEKNLLIVSMVLVGVAWASILSMPYAMLSNAIPAQKMGFYMGVFNFFIVIPQILASLGLGTLMKAVLGNNPMNAVLLGGCSMVAAALCVGLIPKNVDSIREAAMSLDSKDLPITQPAAK